MSHAKFSDTLCGKILYTSKRTIRTFFFAISAFFLFLFLICPAAEVSEFFADWLNIDSLLLPATIICVACYGFDCICNRPISIGGILGVLAGIATSVVITLFNKASLLQIGTPQATRYISHFLIVYFTLVIVNKIVGAAWSWRQAKQDLSSAK